ncbi:hypothetical protein H7169_03920 [Candidatus Gracilibacteria bacterium]|nr:hypothetical protein [Candidatus Gracilibacteria bacterium]
MIQVNSLHYNHPTSTRATRSHTLTPHDAVTLFCIIDGESETTVSILEDHILESISSTSWNIRETSQDFGYITERYNSFVTSFPREDISDIRILLGMLQGENLTLSTVGGTHGVFIEESGNAIDITVHENKSYEFHSITTGKIPVGATVYLSNDNIESLLGYEVLSELSHLTPEAWSDTSKQILEREISSNLHIIRLSRRLYDSGFPAFSRERKKQSDILRDHGAILVEYVRSKKMWEKTKGLIQKIPTLENRKYQYAFIGIGVIILFALAYSLISSILGVLSNTTSDSKNLLIQAKILIDDGQKLTSNPTAFSAKMKEAEKILFDLRKEQSHVLDTQELLGRITSMKKEVYDIQEIDMTNLTSVIPFNSLDITPIGVFEKDKKLTLVGEKGAIMNYVTGDKIIKVTPYPSSETVKSFDIGEDGSIYLLTDKNSVLSPRRDDFARINVTGQNGWEDALSIKTFNGNIYLLETSKNQIQRHKPGVNGFSQKSSLLSKIQPGIFDISIDGGIYIYMDDGKILRYIGDKDTLSSIVLNKIPGEWKLDTTQKSEFISRSYLSYTYILNGDRIWVFQPDSKRFQDVKSWTYIGQLELKTDTPVRHISVPRDGTIHITTTKGVYDLNFEFVDGKIIFK